MAFIQTEPLQGLALFRTLQFINEWKFAMVNRLRITKVLIFLLSLILTLPADSDSTVEQLREQDPSPDDKPVSPDELIIGPQTDLHALMDKYAYLDQHFQLMAQPNSDEDVAISLKRLKEGPNTVRDVMVLYKSLAMIGKERNAYLGEARWRALSLLGDLRNPDAAGFLMEVASSPLPDGEQSDELLFKTDYRLHARAIAGLEKLGDAEALLKLYNEQREMRGLAAASLFELGKPPEGVKEVDGRKVIGYGDPRDFNPGRAPAYHGESPRVTLPAGQKQQDSVMPSGP